MGLRFDMNGLTNEILAKLEEQLNYALIAWRTEVLNKLKHPFYGTDERPYVEYEIKRQSDAIIAYLKANTYVLADSYGTGSLMLSDNPGFKTYMMNPGNKRGQINPARKGKAISGRPAGRYVDIFGREHETSGVYAGDNIEGKVVYRRKKGLFSVSKYKIQPTRPSYALQTAEEWLYKTYLPNAYKLAVKNINFSKYLIQR